ncbi:nitroreductase family protein [Achromobacter piechaudii]|uniref:nitroreductase family protein n=1 Tax=Achromobacter piechaudii TaxID=72556 RepID=UPI0009E420EC|nr:nitroreductase family protein [Achromobacter piechaudii]
MTAISPDAGPHAGPRGDAGGSPAAYRLPPSCTDGGMTLRAALTLRRSTRAYSDAPLSLQQLSDLLWAACGVNRAGGERTAPYWRHRILLSVFVLQPDGVTVYDPVEHALTPYMKGDFRALAGEQDFVGRAPLELVYVARGEKMADITAIERQLYASVDAAFIGQNVYLFCASAGLATVFRGALDKDGLARALHLPDTDFVTFAQTVGFSDEKPPDSQGKSP